MASVKRTLLLVLACCIGLGALALWQRSVARKEIVVFEHIRFEQERQLEMQRAARERRQALEETIQTAEAELTDLRRMLPVEMDVDGLCVDLGKCLAAQGLELCGSSSEIRDRDFYREADLVLEICGEEAGRVALASETGAVQRCAEPRITRLGTVEPIEDHLRVEITAYSYIESERRPPRDWCDTGQWPPVHSWLWPFAAGARAARARLDELCPEIEGHRAELERVIDLENLRRESELARHVIDALSERGARPPRTPS